MSVGEFLYPICVDEIFQTRLADTSFKYYEIEVVFVEAEQPSSLCLASYWFGAYYFYSVKRRKNSAPLKFQNYPSGGGCVAGF